MAQRARELIFVNNISLDIPPGKFVGIAGQSGSGKSTLMKLLPRLYELDRGKILIDDYDKNIREWEAKGGIGIHHTDVGKTISELKRLGFK